MKLLDVLKPGAVFEVNMVKNTLTVDGVHIDFGEPITFNCNWSNEKIIDVVGHIVLNAESHNVSYKDPNDKNSKTELSVYEAVLLQTENHEVMSVGIYRN